MVQREKDIQLRNEKLRVCDSISDLACNICDEVMTETVSVIIRTPRNHRGAGIIGD